MKKIKIYYLLSSEAYLKPISGDRINEMNVIRALLTHYDVYYNGVLCKKDDKNFGREDNKIVVPKEGEYDLIYVRNNRDVFLKSPHPKLWFASPYDKDCFDMADGIVCMTEPWKERLSTYSDKDYEYFVQTYPIDMVTPKNCLLFPQVVELFSEERIEQLRTKKEISKKTFFSRIFNKETNNKKSIRHFGPVRPSNYPHQLAYYLKSTPKLKDSCAFECVGAGKKMSIPKEITNTSRVEQEKAFELLVNSHAIWYNQDASGNIAGSLKILEAMSAGVPILLPRYDARVRELGENYPFFWDLKKDSSIVDVEQPDFLAKLKDIMNMNNHDRNELSKYLRQKAQKHSFENVSVVLKDEIDCFMEKIG